MSRANDRLTVLTAASPHTTERLVQVPDGTYFVSDGETGGRNLTRAARTAVAIGEIEPHGRTIHDRSPAILYRITDEGVETIKRLTDGDS